MSQNEVHTDSQRRILLTKKADPFLTIGSMCCLGFGASLLYNAATVAAKANHTGLIVTGMLLLVIGGIFLIKGGWRTFRL